INMDLTRLAVDAGQFVNRAVQYTGETLGQAERTEFDANLEGLLALAETTKAWTDLIIAQTEVLLQPNPADRLEDRLYERLDWSALPRPRALELLGDTMTQAGVEVGPSTPYGTSLVRCGEAQKHMGEAERQFVQSVHIHFLSPLRSFSEGEYRALQYERRMLVNKRLDLDIAKTRLRKAHEAEAENLNSNPLGDDYVSHVSFMFSFLRVKWLKAEMELRICQSLFDRQAEMTRQLLEGISTTHVYQMRSLTDFVDAQAAYYAQCNQHTQDMHKELARYSTPNNNNNNNNNNNSLLTLTSSVERQAANGLSGLSSAAKGSSGAVTEQELLVPNSTATKTSNSLSDDSSTTARVSNLSTEIRTETSRDSQPQENSVLPPTSNGGLGVLLSTTNETPAPIFAANEIPSDPDVTTANNCLALSETGAPRLLLKCENAVATHTGLGEMASQSLTTCGIADESKTTDHGFSTVCLTTDEKMNK
uniref:BAR domain-containing protein n=1 Tax=Gadus morhua TaxID=8049 RepID=A0A8C5FP61_GADMO